MLRGARDTWRVRIISCNVEPFAVLTPHKSQDFAKTMIPLSISREMPEKKGMIRLFLEVCGKYFELDDVICIAIPDAARYGQAIGAHLEAAKENMDSFSQLARDVEAFPPKVARTIRIANTTSWGEVLFGMVCAGIEKDALETGKQVF